MKTIDNLRVLAIDDEDQRLIDPLMEQFQPYREYMDVSSAIGGEEALEKMGTHPHFAIVNLGANTERGLYGQPIWNIARKLSYLGNHLYLCDPGVSRERLKSMWIAESTFITFIAVSDVIQGIRYQMKAIPGIHEFPPEGFPSRYGLPKPQHPVRTSTKEHTNDLPLPLMQWTGALCDETRQEFEDFLAGREARKIGDSRC